MSKVRSVLLAAVAAVAFGSFANPTIVAWENDFSTLKKDNITLDLQGNAVDGDGGVTIGSKGIKLTRDAFCATASNAAVTVIVEASNITAAGALGGVMYDATSDVTARRNADGTVSTWWTKTKTGTSTKTLTDAGQHRLAFVCGNSRAQLTGLHAYVDGEEWVSAPGYYSSYNPIVGVLVGGNIAGDLVMTGMKMSRIAVVDGALTPAEVAAYVWPSARNGYYDHFKANFSDRVISMTARSTGFQSIYNFTGTLFDLGTLADTTKTYNGSTVTTDLPGYTGETGASTWNIFCTGQKGYVAPGCVMRIPPCSPGCSWRCKQEINNMAIAGLIVEEGAVGTKVVDKMLVPGDPVGYVAASARPADFGDTSGSVPSWFILKESFLADNIGSTVTLYGELNFDIAEGRVLHFQTVDTPTVVTMNTGKRTTLKMHGAGTIKLRTLTATGDVGLDYSDLPLDRETPYIDGSITINASTRITLPAGADGAAFYMLCSGVVTASALPASIKVGDADVTDYSIVGNKIVFAKTEWTGAGEDENWTTTENWSAGLPTPSVVACFPLGKTAVLEDLSALDCLFVVGGSGWEINGAVSVTTVDVGVMAAAGIGGARILRCTAAEKPAITVVNGDGYRAFWHGDWLCVTSASDETLARYARWAGYGPKIWTWKSSGGLNAELHLFDPVLGCRTGETNPVATGSAWHIFCDSQKEYEPGAIFRMEASFGSTGTMLWPIAPSVMGGFIIEPGATGHELSCAATDNRNSYIGDAKDKTGETWSIIDEDFVNSHGTSSIRFYGICNVEIADEKTFTLKSALPTVAANATLKMHGAGTLKVEDRTTPAATPPENAGLLQAISGAGLDYSDLPADRAAPYIDGGIVIDKTTKITIPAALADGGRFMLCSGTVVAKGLPASVWVGDEEVADYALVGNEIVIGTTMWTNASGDGNWSTAENWSNGLPGEGSVVVLGEKTRINVESADVFAGVTVAGRGWTIDGTVSTTEIDFAMLSAMALNGTCVIRCTAAEKPAFTAVNLDDRFRTTWNGDNFIATLATVTDETLAYYRPWADYGPNMYTWANLSDLSSSAKQFYPLYGFAADANYSGSAWGIFCSSKAEYEPGAVFRVAPGSYSKGQWAVTPLCVGAFLVEPGALNAEISSTASDRISNIGDVKGNAGETWSRIDSDFTMAHGRAQVNFCGLVNIEIAEGTTFTIKTAEPAVAPDATLRMHGAGTLKFEDRDDPKTPPPEDASFLRALNNAGLDFSDLSLDREAPFIDGGLKVDATTRFAFPADLAENTPYPLCSGTLRAPAEGVLTKVLVGDEEKFVILSFAGNSASYRLTDNVVARIGNRFFDTVQEAFDAADETSVIDVIKGGTVTLAASKTIKSLNTFDDMTINGAGTLTFAAGGSLAVEEGKTVTVNAPLVIGGTVAKLGLGAVAANGSVSTDGVTAGDFVVRAGTADFNGAITKALIRGCGTDAANWPVITLKANCTVSDGAVVTPVRYTGTAADGASVPCYGKVIQNGASYAYPSGMLELMGPNGGAGTYVLNAGSISCGSEFCFQDGGNYRTGRMTVEMNGGELTASEFNMCRTGTSDNDTYRALLVLNGGYFSVTTIKGTTNIDSKDGHFYVGWQEHKRIELNGGTFNIRNNALLYSTNIVWVVASGDITLANSAGTTTVVPDCLAGMDSLTFAGAGTLDVSGLPAGTCDDYRVTGGALLLGEGNVSETTTLKASGSGKFGLEFEGVRDIKTYFVGNRQKTIGYEYGVNAHGATRFVETDPAGAVRLLEGNEPIGVMFLVR